MENPRRHVKNIVKDSWDNVFYVQKKIIRMKIYLNKGITTDFSMLSKPKFWNYSYYFYQIKMFFEFFVKVLIFKTFSPKVRKKNNLSNLIIEKKIFPHRL